MGKRRAFSAKEKLAVIQHVKKTGNVAGAVSHFFPLLTREAVANRHKLVWSWKRDEERLLVLCEPEKSAARKKARPQGITASLSPGRESEIVAWVNDLRGEGVPASLMMLALYAREVAAAYGVDGIQASWWWQKRFLARHKMAVRARTRQGQVLPLQLNEIAVEFGRLVRETMAQLGVDTVWNADQTATFFEYLPKQTIDEKEARTVWVRRGGGSKGIATVMLLGDSSGRKCTPFVIFKAPRSKIPERHKENVRERHGFGRTLWREIELLESEFQIHGNAEGKSVLY